MCAMTDHDNRDERLQVLSSVLTQVLAAQEDERRMVIHALKENVGQELTALALNLRVLEKRCDQTPCLELIGEMRNIVSGVMREIDRVQRSLYPPALDSQGLIPAVEMYMQEFAHATQIRVELDAEVLPRRLPAAAEIALFRSVEDILEQMRQQVAVSEIRVRLRFIKEFAYLAIEIDGALSTRASWREELVNDRVSALGGCCAITPMAHSGTQYAIALPVYTKESP